MNNPCKHCESFCLTADRMKCEKYIKYDKVLEGRRKYQQGERITTMEELGEQQWVFWFGKPKHIAVIKSLQYRSVEHFLKSGCFYKCERREKGDGE